MSEDAAVAAELGLDLGLGQICLEDGEAEGLLLLRRGHICDRAGVVSRVSRVLKEKGRSGKSFRTEEIASKGKTLGKDGEAPVWGCYIVRIPMAW